MNSFQSVSQMLSPYIKVKGCLNKALIDTGSSTISRGQAYVALSRLINLPGALLINIDLTSIKVQQSAIA